MELTRGALLSLLLIIAVLFGAGPCGPVIASGSSVERTIIAEPSYQIYEDRFILASPSDNFTVSFILPYYQSLYSAQAFGPDNSTLNVLVSWYSANGSLSLLVETGGLSSFTLKTIFHYTTFRSNGSYTTYVNLYPSVGEQLSASVTLFPPSGAQLLSYPQNLSLTTIGGKPALVGGEVLVPNEGYNATVVYNGSFELVEINALERNISVSSNGLAVTETVQLKNVDLGRIDNVTIKVPSGASSLKVYDSIGYMNYLVNGDSLTIMLRSRILPTEKSSFTIYYEVPAAVAFQSNGGKTLLNQTFLPSWCQFLVRSFNLVVTLPPGSSQVDPSGLTIINATNGFELMASAQDITPHSDPAFAISFILPPYSVPVGAIVISFIVLLSVVSFILAIRRKAKQIRQPEAPPPPPAKPKRTRR